MKKKPLIWTLILLMGVAGCGGSGDRVIVSKYHYDILPGDPERHDVVVFRFPVEPLKDGTPINYIKRLIGLAGETVAIFFGQLFYTTEIEHDDYKTVDAKELWKSQYMHKGFMNVRGDGGDGDKSIELFKEGKFKIMRKSPANMLAMRRIVYDNDFQGKDLKDILPSRWNGETESAWTADDRNRVFQHKGSSNNVEWLRYRHILRPPNWPSRFDPNYDQRIMDIKKDTHPPQLITDFSGYNSYESPTHPGGEDNNWVGDLMLEFDVQVEASQGEFWVELSKGVDRFQARWDLQTGTCTLVRLQDGEKEKVLASEPSNLKDPGTYTIRFANFDERLTVWINRQMPFGDGVDYDRPWYYDKDKDEWGNTGPTENDLQPASVGSKGAAVQVQRLQIWRDTYYTLTHQNFHHRGPEFWSDPARWGDMQKHPPLMTMYVQPGHYLCLGDNSPESYDSRSWGSVPERLMLGRALIVYWPSSRLGTIIH